MLHHLDSDRSLQSIKLLSKNKKLRNIQKSKETEQNNRLEEENNIDKMLLDIEKQYKIQDSLISDNSLLPIENKQKSLSISLEYLGIS